MDRNFRALLFPVWDSPNMRAPEPAIAQSLGVCVSILGNDPGDPFKMFEREMETGWLTVVEDINGEFL